MGTNLRDETSAQVFQKAAAGLVLLMAISVLVACQGLSAGGTGVNNSPGTLTANPASVSFGNVTVGKNASISGTLSNSGSGSVTISKATISGAGYTLGGINAGTVLAAGQTANFSVQFAPSTSGTSNGTLTITSDASDSTLSVPVSGVGTTATGQLGANPTSLSFGNVAVGQNKSLSETITNSGTASVTISQIAISGSGFTLSGATSSVTLAAGQSTTFSVKFTPTSASNASGTITVSSNASNPSLAIPVTGTGTAAPGQLSSNPASLSFGSVTVGSSQSLSVTLTNTGGSSVSVSNVQISGSGFSLSGIGSSFTLAAGQSTTFNVRFAPTTSGAASGSVTIASNASNPALTVALSGTGTVAVGTLSVSPATLNLGSVTVGSSNSLSGQLTASGANVTVTAATTNNSSFTVSGLTLPVTIAAGQSVSYTITFSPQTAGTVNATLTVTSNAQPSTTTEALTGTGTSASTHSVNLSWNASTSSNVTGYNIYRALYTTSCGSYSKINSLLNTTTLYTDSTVVNGSSYCYAATAVDTSNQESGYSNIVSNVQIP
jgi:hypothetical protein